MNYLTLSKLLLSVVCVFILLPASSQNKREFKVSGIVTDVNKNPLVGTSIKEVGTSRGTTTDSDGLFEFYVSSSLATLEVSYLSFETLQVKVSNRSSLKITLKESDIALSDIIVVGYGKTSGKDITGSIVSLSENEMNKGPVKSIAQMIQGKVAGVYISKDGDPNSEGSLIIRGTSTLRTGAQTPLYVIDGVPGAGMVSPEDIVSIDILKDASATAIYGSRAANGVIMVTTRQGKNREQKYTTANVYVNIEQVSNRYDMMTGDEYRNYLTSNGSAIEPGWDDGVDTDWQKEVMRTAIMHNYYLTTGGAVNQTHYDASINFYKQEGIIKTTGQQKALMRANVEQAFLNNRLNVGMTLNGTIANQALLPSASNVYRSMLTFVPTTLATHSDGTYKEDIDRRDLNPVAALKQNQMDRTNKTLFGSIRAHWDILPGLSFNTIFSHQNHQTNTGVYLEKDSKFALGKNGEARRSAYESTETIFENYLAYEQTIKDHKLGAMLGYSWQESTTGDGFQSSNINFMSDATGYYNLQMGSAPEGYNVLYGDVTMKALRMISFFGRLNYSYKQRYILQASLRNDGSSAFGKNSRWGWFPSLSAAWRVINEPFMDGQGLFSDLKLKAGYGISGNSFGFDPMVATLRYGSVGKSYYNGAYINSIGVVQNENPDLRWEKTAMLNIGLDAAFLDARLKIGLEWYNKYTSDLIWEYDVPATKYLYNKMTANVGEISNTGIELSLNYDVLSGQTLHWSTGFTLAHNRNKIESLSDEFFKIDYVLTGTSAIGAGQSGGSAQIIKEGYPIGTFYTLKFQGFSDDGKSLFLNKDGDITASPVAPDDYYICGDAQPKLNYSWTNNLSWRGFSLDWLFRGVAGHTILNSTLAKLTYSSRVSHYNQPRYVLESKQAFNDIRSHFTSDRYIQRADFLRLENISLGYTLPMNNPYIRQANVYLTLSNAFILTNYKGIDPEIDMGGIEPGIDNNNMYPKTRSYQIGVKLNF
ncbi:MAG: SusC/RagA family TonB-linked outer membrane protein [Tannerellaceae bacterium]|jgi:iron complex outermembrane receptor protein|nr:SusC/RagA family TonB-linked outer membrane protein [Tannerellaceae bacterium]